MDEKKAQLEALEKEKGDKIQHYLSLQDQADDLNEVIYRLCCDIEILNKKIKQAREEYEKAILKAAAKEAVKPSPANGTSKR